MNMPTPISFDTETWLIEPARLAPPMVCLTSATPSAGAKLFHANPEKMPKGALLDDLLSYGDFGTARSYFCWILKQDPIYTANGAYDMGVCLRAWPELFTEVFAAYEDDRVIDVQLSQQLIDNAEGKMDYFLKYGGGYSLGALVKRILKKDRSEVKEGPDAWRLRYKELTDVELGDWPNPAARYPLDDAQDTLDIGQHQWLNHRNVIGNSPAQARAAFALQLMMCWGVKTDPDKIAQLRDVAEEKYWQLTRQLVKYGLVRGEFVPSRDALEEFVLDSEGFVTLTDKKTAPKKVWTSDTKATKLRMFRAYKAQGMPIKLTDTGYEKFKEYIKGREKNSKLTPELVLTEEELLEYTSTDEDACKESGDDVLYDYSLRKQLGNIVNTHVPDLLEGVVTPIQPRYTTMVDSGRTACSKNRSEDGKKKKASPTNGFQFQNPKRGMMWIPPGEKKAVPLFPPGVGVRECFVARDITVVPDKRFSGRTFFADNDFSGLELCTGAQACIATVGYSRLGDAINAGRDPHLQFAAKLMGISYEEALTRKHEKEVKHCRNLAKIANFGYPGGLGFTGLVGFARGYGVKLTTADAKKLRDDWFEEFPEWVDYFKWIRSHIDPVTGRGQVLQLYANRLRGGVKYTAACNTLFQGLGADGAKHALYEVQKRCYMKIEGSTLYGARPVGFIHDEILAEVFVEIAHEQAVEMARVMVDACNQFLPDVPVKCEPALCKHWTKEVEGVYDAPPKDGGRLVPYDLAKKENARVFYIDGKQVKWAA